MAEHWPLLTLSSFVFRDPTQLSFPSPLSPGHASLFPHWVFLLWRFSLGPSLIIFTGLFLWNLIHILGFSCPHSDITHKSVSLASGFVQNQIFRYSCYLTFLLLLRQVWNQILVSNPSLNLYSQSQWKTLSSVCLLQPYICHLLYFLLSFYQMKNSQYYKLFRRNENAVRHYFTPTKTASKKQKSNKCLWALIHSLWECVRAQPTG